MADCEKLPTCPFFNDQMKGSPSTAEIFKNKYCRGNNSSCARYMVLKALGKEKVPANLYPNEIHKAQEIIAQG